jgi:hypothetical protein
MTLWEHTHSCILRVIIISQPKDAKVQPRALKTKAVKAFDSTGGEGYIDT